MKKYLLLISFIVLSTSVYAFDYVPKNVDKNPFSTTTSKTQTVQNKTIPSNMREIKTIEEYFRYLPKQVHRNWTPYKADKDYEIVVEFYVHRDGKISGARIISTDYPNANQSVLNAVKTGSPYQPLPASYIPDSVKAQIILEYHKQ